MLQVSESKDWRQCNSHPDEIKALVKNPWILFDKFGPNFKGIIARLVIDKDKDPSWKRYFIIAHSLKKKKKRGYSRFHLIGLALLFW